MKEAWINHFLSCNSFCAEMEAVIQAFELAQEMQINKAMFEDDSLQVVLSLQGLNNFCDWRRARTNISKGKLLLRKFYFWSIFHVNRSCNSLAHRMASWARSVDVNGKIDVTTIPPKSFVIWAALM